MGNGNNPTRMVTTTGKVFAILEQLKETDGARVSELAEELGYAKSTVHRHLATLEHYEYVIKEGDTYNIGLRFIDFGEYAKSRKKAYVMAAKKVGELADETDERAQFLVEEHGHAVYVHRGIGKHAVQTDPGVGKRVPLHATAAGKAIFAHLPEPRITRILENKGLPALTEQTITDEDDLRAEFETIRERGYSINSQENITGLRAIGVPIMASNDTVIGALSVSGPTQRMKGAWFEQDLPELLLGTANELQLNIQYA